MILWENKPYWVLADDISRDIYHQLFSTLEVRGLNYSNYSFFLNEKDYIEIDIKHRILSDESLNKPDNIGCCISLECYSEIEIVTILPKYYRIKKLKNLDEFKSDFLNVIRHEIEHAFQGLGFDDSIKEYKHSENNFLLKKYEIMAYVHGFRIASNSYDSFKASIDYFVEMHGANIKLSNSEILKTKNIWYKELKNLGTIW